MALLESTCTNESLDGCYNAGVLLRDGMIGVASNQDRATEYFELGCKKNDAGACANLGIQMFLGRGTASNPVEALPLMTQGCSIEDGESCFYLGVAARDGKGRAANPEDAAQYFKKGCEFKFADACKAQGFGH